MEKERDNNNGEKLRISEAWRMNSKKEEEKKKKRFGWFGGKVQKEINEREEFTEIKIFFEEK